MANKRRWYCIEQRLRGQNIFLGRIETTEAELREAVGHYADINSTNGHCLVWGVKKGN